ncbi:hypothetical protein BD414DRAFT_531920 [Trametes punicea]|nr:hypothetical protein BD414DRAFT_531920 [Trametes punicea]
MTSLHKYAAQRHKASYYCPGVDPTSPTGTPVEVSAPTAAQDQMSPDHGECCPSLDEQINEPLGCVEEIAREYARLRNELGPKPTPSLDEEARRLKEMHEKEEQGRREHAVFAAQYHKLVSHTAYVENVWRRMEERGYFDLDPVRGDGDSVLVQSTTKEAATSSRYRPK